MTRGLAILLVCGATVAHAGTLSTTPNPKDFGNVSVSAGASASTVTITNTGSSTTINGITKAGAGCSEFTAALATTPPFVMAGGDTAIVNLSYDPVDRVADSCTVTINDNNGVVDTFVLQGDGTAAQLVLSPTPTLAFADQNWSSGTGEVLNVTVMNVGEEDAAMSNITTSLATGTQFSIGSFTGLPIMSGNSATLPITFNPTSVGAKSDTLTIALDNDPPSLGNYTLTLTGNGTQTFSTSPTSLDFATVNVGSFADLPLTIKNDSAASATVSSITSGDSVYTFTVTGAPLPRLVSAGGTVAVTVRFTPVDGSIKSTNLTIATTGAPANLLVPLTGDGLYKAVGIAIQGEPDSMVDLGNRRVGTTTTKLVTVTDTGETSINLSLPTSNDSHCVVEKVNPTTYPANLASAGQATFNIKTTPTAVGPGTCTITIASDIPTTDTIDISYNGIAPEVALIAPTNGMLPFGVVDVDAGPSLGNVVVKNTGSDVLAISGCAITGSARFTMVTDCSQIPPIAPLESATLTVAYDPAVEASETGQLMVQTDALSGTAVAVALSGIGGDQHIVIDSLAISFPDTTLDPMPPPNARIHVTNPVQAITGTAEPLVLSMVSSDQSVFEVTNPGPFTIDAGGMQELAVLFRPKKPGPYEGTLTITSDVTMTPMAAITMSGRGIAEASDTGGGCCDSGTGTAQGPLILLVALVLRRRRRN